MKLSVFAAALLASNAIAGTVTIDRVKEMTFTPENSELLEFRVTVDRFASDLSDSGKSYGSKMLASYKTKEIESLEDYVVVQYIKGCFYKVFNISGKKTVDWGVAREFFGGVVKFKHPEWVIDSVDLDPVYNSGPGLRHDFYRWSQGEIEGPSEKFFSQAPPSNNRLYVRDIPGTSWKMDYPEFDASVVTNSSLKFKTCIFKTEDVPLTVPSPETDITEKAIKCFEWSNSYVYNDKTGAFDSPEEIDPVCLAESP